MKNNLNEVMSFFTKIFVTLVYKDNNKYKKVKCDDDAWYKFLLLNKVDCNGNVKLKREEICEDAFIKASDGERSSGAQKTLKSIYDNCLLNENINELPLYLEEIIKFSCYHEYTFKNHSKILSRCEETITYLDKAIDKIKDSYEQDFDYFYIKKKEKIVVFLKQYETVFLSHNISMDKLNNNTASLFLTLLIAIMIHSIKFETGVKKLTEEHRNALEKEIINFARENNLGSGKLTQEDLRAFPYVDSKDTDKTKFKRISEFFITPTIELNNSYDTFRCVIEGKSGVGKSTLLKAITNIFVIENTDTTEFGDNEKTWYESLKKSIFTKNDKTYIPVFIEATKANKATPGFKFLDLADGYEKTLLENIVSCNDNVLFLIDGIEEVKKDKRDAFKHAFEEYFDTNEKVNIIITTRYLGGFDWLNQQHNFVEVALEKLSYESIEAYIKKSNIFEENIRAKIFEILSISEDVKNLACNPFMFERLVMHCENTNFTVFQYLNKTVNDIIKLRWNSPGEYIKNMLGYVATKGNEFNYNRFMSLINTMPKPLSRDYNNATKNQQEYEMFKEEWESNSGILSYANNAEGEKVSFDEPLIRSYLASLYIKRWFAYIRFEAEEGEEEYLCPKKPSKDINYFEYLDLIKLIDKTFDLTDKNVLQAFLMVLSSREKGMDDFEDPIIMMSVFLKYSSLSMSDADEVNRNNIIEFFQNLKSNAFGNNIVTNDSCKPSQLAMKNNVDYIIYGNNQVNKDEQN